MAKSAEYYREYRLRKKAATLGLRPLALDREPETIPGVATGADPEPVVLRPNASYTPAWEYMRMDPTEPKWGQPPLRLVFSSLRPLQPEAQPQAETQPVAQPAAQSQPEVEEMQPVAQPQPVVEKAQPTCPSCATTSHTQPVAQPLQALAPQAFEAEHKVAQLQPLTARVAQPFDLASLLLCNLKTTLICATILVFVICNTAYLAYEQHAGYLALGYSVPLAWGIAVLCEVAIEILSFSFAYADSRVWKLLLASTLGASLYIMAGLVSQSAESKAHLIAKKPLSLTLAEGKAEALASQLKATTDAILGLDPIEQRTKIMAATAELNRKGGLADQLQAAQGALKAEEIAFAQSELARAERQAADQGLARKLALAWNVVLVQFLGWLVRRKIDLYPQASRP